MSALRFLFVLAFFVFPVFAQNAADEAAKEKLRRQSALLEQILGDAKNFRLPENRAYVYAKAGNYLWQSDEKRAREFFQNSIGELITAQAEAENEKGNKQFLNNLIYGQSPRWEILNAIAAHDADFALDALTKTRPPKMARLLADFSGYYQSQSGQYARTEIQNEQRLIALAAEQNPQRAVKLLRESLKRDVTFETVNLLKKIYPKDAETANALAEEVGRKLLASKVDEDNQDSSFIQYFIGEFGLEKTADVNAPKISDALLRDLSAKIVKFILRPNAASYSTNEGGLKIAERFFPAEVAQIRQKQARIQSQYQNQNPQYQSYEKLLQSDSSSEELLSQAGTFPRSYRTEIYRRAAEKTAKSGNLAEAEKILTANMSEEESESYLSQMNYNLASEAISQGKFDVAQVLINQIPAENNRLSALTYLATSVYQKNPKENQKWASSILEQARGMLPDAPEKSSEIAALLNIASAYATIEPGQAFRIIDALIAPLNELSEASAIVAKYSDNVNFRLGEYQINQGGSVNGAYNFAGVLQILKTNDFERAVRFTNAVSRPDARIVLQLQLLGDSFLIQNLPVSGRIIINGGERRHWK